MARSVEARIEYMRNHPPHRVGLCAKTVWLSLDVPPLGAASASIAAGKVRHAGKLHTSHTPPRGAVVLWTGGSHGYGHAALSLGHGKILTTDPPGHPGGVGVQPLNMPQVRWGLHYAGWTTWWGVQLPGGTSGHPSHDHHPHVKLANLHYGEKNNDVKQLQRALNVHPVSGYYGPKTDQAVRANQRSHGWHPDHRHHSSVGPVQARALRLVAT